MVVAWIHDGTQIETATLGRNAKPRGHIRTLARSRSGLKELHLVANRSGDDVLVWRSRGTPGSRVEAAVRRAGKLFGRPVVVASGANAEPAATIDNAGRASIVFTHFMHSNRPSKLVEESTRNPGGHWSKPTPLAATSATPTEEPRISTQPQSGRLIAIWTSNASQSAVVQAATREPGTQWTTPVTISPEGSADGAVAFSEDGDATATWVRVRASGESATEWVETADWVPG